MELENPHHEAIRYNKEMGSRATEAKVDVLGVHVGVTCMAEALARIVQWVDEESPSYVCVTGVHGVMECQADPQLREIHNRAGLVVPDGRPMLWCGRRAGATGMQQVRGIELTLKVVELAAGRGWPVFLYGGAEGTPELLEQKLCGRFPSLKIAGTLSPPFRALTQVEESLVLSRINNSGAKVVLVGLSTPKQERWMAKHVGQIDADVLIGVGAAFDVHAELVKEAPKWVSPLGLEWCYRLVREPRRLWRRYLLNNPKFAMAILRNPPTLVRG
jgi:N-acetylglucosaminyldiphosphoundecaprenol N-acetyl-beta-D-mannosaminyltransferase